MFYLLSLYLRLSPIFCRSLFHYLEAKFFRGDGELEKCG